MSNPLRDHVFLGTTESLCPDCRTVVKAKIVSKVGRVYFQKRCPTHGTREDFVCSDVREYDRTEFSVAGKLPAVFGANVERGCPLDCGLCPDHEQHTCIGLVEITTSCNLKCPMCYAGSGPHGVHLSYDEACRAIDRLVDVEGGAEVLQLSGGEPTVHPEFLRILAYAYERPIEMIMINTNGIRLATDPALLAGVAHYKSRLELYFQFDSFKETATAALRGGAALVEEKLKALELLGQAGVRVTLVSTLQPGVNDDEIGDIVRFAAARPFIGGVSFQPATYTGRHVLPEDLERRITFPDVVRAIEAQTEGMLKASDFIPLPCAHPNCHTLTYAYRKAGALVPLARLFDPRKHIDVLANGISFTRARARRLVEDLLAKACREAGCTSVDMFLAGLQAELGIGPEGEEFFRRALTEDLSPSDVFRVVITSFMDPYNFDVRRVMKCCIHHVLPSGHVIPFCAYNTLYRDGHVPLPALATGGRAVSPVVPGEKLVTLRGR